MLLSIFLFLDTSYRKLDSDLTTSAYSWEVSGWEQALVLPACSAACIGDKSPEAEKWPHITLHLEREAAWHWPCNPSACLLHTNVPVISLISCCVFPALSISPSFPAVMLCRKPNAKIGLCRNFEVIIVLWVKSGQFLMESWFGWCYLLV